MPQVNIATSLAPSEFPGGTQAGAMRYRLLTAAGLSAASLTVPAPISPVVTLSVAAYGTYTLTIQRLDGSGLALGPLYTAPSPVVVAPPAPVMIDLPVGAEVTVS